MKVLDFFCGTGGLGIECISRGFKKVCFIDNSKIAIELTKKNLNLIRAQKFAEIYNSDFRNLKFTPFKADIFFLDPPYKDKNLEILLKNIQDKFLLKSNGIIVLHRHKDTKDNIPTGFKILEEKRYGISRVIFISCLN